MTDNRPNINTVLHGNCIDIMAQMESESVDFILTDPPYLCNYRDRTGRSIKGDIDGGWLLPAFTQMFRVLKDDALCVSFYGWHVAEQFLAAWRQAGFTPVEHIVFRKHYGSSKRFMKRKHEQAYLLAAGRPRLPDHPIADVIEWQYTGNRLHPTQKPVSILTPLIEAFCPIGGTVLDPFCGSGSTLVAARKSGRSFIGIELDADHHETASRRLFPDRDYPAAA
jgi:DNA modification methylase